MKKIFFLLPIVTALWSCETVVDIDLPEHKPVLVMNGVLSTDSVLKVKITHSKSSLDDAEIQPIQNAAVSLYLPGGQHLGDLTHTGGGYYSIPAFIPVAGTQYVIEASAPNYDKISATDVIQAPVQIAGFSLKDSAVDLGGGYMVAQLDVTFNDPGDKNYYMVELLKIDTLFPDTPYVEQIRIFPANSESSSEEEGLNGVLINDDFFNGKTYTVSVLLDSYQLEPFYQPNNTLKLQLKLKTISRDLYLYEKTFNLQQQNSGNPFSEPVRVHSNITGGFGILGAYSADEVRIK